MSRTALAAGRLTIAAVILLGMAAACSEPPTPPVPSAPSAPALSHRRSGDEATPPSISSRPEVSDPIATPGTASRAEPAPGTATISTAPPPVRQGSVAQSGRVRFVPRQIELPSGNSAEVEPERTVNGVLQIPADIRHVGWWDGSASAGDPFGATVIAGHVDSREQGLGYFAELLLIEAGDHVTLKSDTATLTYRVVSATLVDKDALASESQALDQRGPHRLVLITCSGQWHPEVRSYDSNLVVIAEPVVS